MVEYGTANFIYFYLFPYGQATTGVSPLPLHSSQIGRTVLYCAFSSLRFLPSLLNTYLIKLWPYTTMSYVQPLGASDI